MFYRIAVEKDFDIDSKFDLPLEVKAIVAENDISKAASELRKRTGMGLLDCKNQCVAYQAFLTAKKDFEIGKIVYTSY